MDFVASDKARPTRRTSWEFIIRSIVEIVKKSKNREVLILYGGVLIQLILNMVISVVVTRSLKPEQYGHYSFVLALINLVLLIVSTGHFVSTSMILAQSRSVKENRSLIGTCLLISLLISCLFSATIFGFSFLQDYIFQDKLGHPLRLLAVPLIFFPLQIFLENVLMGLGSVTLLTALRVLPKLLYLMTLLILLKMRNIDYLMAVLLMLFTSAKAIIFRLCSQFSLH